MGNSNHVLSQMDIDKRPMSKYYREISSLYYSEKSQEINMNNV